MKELKGSWSDESAAASEDSPLPKKTIVELFRQALLVSSPGNDQLLNSAMVLAHAMGNSLLVQKLEKMRLFGSLNHGADAVEFSPIVSSEKILAQQEDFIRQAAQKLESIKLQSTKNVLKARDFNTGTEMNDTDKNNNKWVVAKSWSACPIGMLPSDVGYSGCLPLLDTSELLIEWEEHGKLEIGSRKRPSTISGDFSDASALKKKREIGNFYKADTAADEPWTETGTTGHLMIGGVLKKVGAEEVHAIASGVRILV